MEKNYLVINAGNTSVTFAMFRGGRIKEVIKTPTATILHDWGPNPSLQSMRPYTAFISSVVPSLDQRLTAIALALAGRSPVWITPESDTGLKIEYFPKASLGTDRLANAVAAHLSFPGQPVITVDIGTAINVDCVTEDAKYIGGMISPGPEMAARALSEFTGKLPLVDLQSFSGTSIGQDTGSCIASGILLGTAGLVERLIKECKKTVGQEAIVIATGGGAPPIIRLCHAIDRHDPHLTLKGIYYIGARDSKMLGLGP